MAYMYVLALGSLPSPWTRVTTYDSRYVRFGTSGFGGVGGDLQHRHVTIATNSGANTVTTSGEPISYYNCYVVPDHSHPISAVNTGYSNNDPLYYTLALWRMDASTWEASYRSFPANVVVLSYTAVSATGFSRFTSADGRLIKLGDPNSSGGRSTHNDHSVSVTLDTVNAPSSVLFRGGAGTIGHSHTYDTSTVPAGTSFPLHLKTRLYYTTAQTVLAPAGIVCFFDGTPSANWTAVDWGTRFVMSYDSNPTNGGDVHNHNGISGTSTSYDGAGDGRYSGASICDRPHDHAVNLNTTSVEPIPLYVTLVPYRLTTTLYGTTEQTKTFSVDALLKMIKPKTVLASVTLKKPTTKTIGADALLRVTKPETAESDALLKKLFDQSVTATVFVVQRNSSGLSAGADLMKTDASKTVDFSAYFRAAVPSEMTIQAALVQRHSSGLPAGAALRKEVGAEVGAVSTVQKSFIQEVNLNAFVLGQASSDIQSGAAVVLRRPVFFQMGAGISVEFSAAASISVRLTNRPWRATWYPLVRETVESHPRGGKGASSADWSRKDDRAGVPLRREELDPVNKQTPPADPVDWDRKNDRPDTTPKKWY